MSICLSCAEWVGRGSLCASCESDLIRAHRFRVPGDIEVVPAFRHVGAARRLVHRLKYHGVVEVADVFAQALVTHLPAGATCLVPLPRATVRRLRFGVDPAAELARAIRTCSGLPVVACLRPSLWWPRHATTPRHARGASHFRAVSRPPAGAVLVDDVATSGATLAAAAEALETDFRHGIVATAPGRMAKPASSEAGEVPWRQART